MLQFAHLSLFNPGPLQPRSTQLAINDGAMIAVGSIDSYGGSPQIPKLLLMTLLFMKMPFQWGWAIPR